MRALVLVAVLAAAPAIAQAKKPEGAPDAAASSTATTTTGPRLLRLDDAVRIARDGYPQLRGARAASEAAAARADEARAPLLPQLTGTASYQRSTSNFVPRSGSAASSLGATENSWQTEESWSFGATASQLVWDFGGTGYRWRAARESAASVRESERATLAQTVLGVRTAYFAARAAKDLVGVARETVANQDAHLRQVQGFVEVGTRPEIDLAQARADRANAQVQLIGAENGYDTARAQLAQAMGLDAPADFEIADDTLPPLDAETLAPEALLAEALRARPELAAQERQLGADRATVGAVRGTYLPALGISTGITADGPSVPGAVPNWSATATLTWKLFQGGLTRAQEREALANLDGAGAQLASLRQQIRLEVEQARLAVRASKASLAAAGDALASARDRLRLAEGRYKAGAGGIIELGDAQVALTSAAAQRVQAEYGLASSRAKLLAALGRDAPPR